MANYARSAPQKAMGVAEAKAKVIELIRAGHKVDDACKVVGRKPATYLDWRKTDKEFAAAVDKVRELRGKEKDILANGKPQLPDFPTFCADYLKQPLHIHQLRMWDVIEGREPRDLLDMMNYEPGYLNRILINVPPEHAKSTTFTVNWVLYQIYRNPDIRIVIVSKGSKLANDFLYEIKMKLTSPVYREMQMLFGPEDGWQDPDQSWTNDRIYVRGKNTGEDGVQKDPTIQTMGLRGTIYGRRADIVIMDDIIDAENAREIDTQLRKINRDIGSRLPSDDVGGGTIIVLGTRVAPMDIYRVLSDLEDGDGRRVWTYFRQPAVLDYGNGDSDTWVTLWPEKWSGPALSRRRVDAGWNLYYQQLDVDDDMTFKAEAVNASINGLRFPGPMTADGKGHRANGMSGLYVAIGLDPAATGSTAIIVAGLDKETGKRWVIDGWNKPNANASDIIAKFKELTDKYHPHEWVIEKNAFQRFLTQLPDIVDYARARGVKITPHHTTANKFDVDWGVQTMGPLFDSCVKWDDERRVWAKTGTGLIELPSTRQNPWVNQLVQQLTIWQPEGMAQKQKTDLVMALWFTHIAFMAQMNRKVSRQTHYSTAFTTPAARKRQTVINLTAIRRERQEQAMEGIA